MTTIRTSFIDDPLASQQFHSGDTVRKPGLSGLFISPYAGRVLWSNVQTGKVQVQWPWGSESESASELILLRESSEIPPNYDQSYSTWEKSRYQDFPEVLKSDQKWRSSISSVINQFNDNIEKVRFAACKHAMNDVPEPLAIYLSSVKHSDEFSHDVISSEVKKVYSEGLKLAIYWKDNKRRFRVTQREKNAGVLECPRCDGCLKPRVYRQGRRVLLCKTCGFTISPRDLVFK